MDWIRRAQSAQCVSKTNIQFSTELFGTAVISVVFSITASASEPITLHPHPTQSYLQLDIEHRETPLQLDQEVFATIDHAGISLQDNLAPGTVGTLDIGLVSATLREHPITKGMDLTGNYLGFGIIQAPSWQSALQPWLGADYTFHQVDDTVGARTALMRWHEFAGHIGIVWRSSDNTAIRLAAHYEIIDGTETISGDTAQTTSFENNAGSWASEIFTWELEPGGYVGASLQQGARSGWRITFAREF